MIKFPGALTQKVSGSYIYIISEEIYERGMNLIYSIYKIIDRPNRYQILEFDISIIIMNRIYFPKIYSSLYNF